MKKVLSLVLALLMTASTASAVLADDVVAIAEEPVAVEEVAEEVEAGQYDKAIEFLANYGIFKGYNADDTGAEDLIQRYQMALFVGRIATGWVDDEQWEDGPENWSEFDDIDVDPVNKYYGALSFANQKGIIEGYGNGKFGPTDSIKYQDALTMVVRTLGYTGLDWPWGYIQKAVELGLTDGITGVAYTDELTRGEVAQIIYNALFADMKDGSNLALKNFGIEFGWEKVVITASNINTFGKLATDKGTNVEKELVEFKLLNDDGTLADDSYKALAADFNLDYTKHEDDLAVGDAYYVLFEKDADSELAEIVAVESLLVDVIENEGKTDDDAEEQEYAIQEFLADYTLVNKYTTDNYLNITASLKPELLVWDVVGGITEDVVDGYAIAIDWNEGHILGYNYEDGEPVDMNEDGDITKEDYVVQWYYNTLLGRYYEEQYNKDGELIGINYMTDEEFEEFYESTVIKAKKNYKGFTAITSIAKTAYATLEVFDTNLDGVADRALYESYKLGYFSNSTVKCCDKDRASYKISGVNTLAKTAAYNGNDKEALDVAAINTLVEGVCDHGKAWFVEGYTPVVAYDEDGEEAGYEAGYVIYSYDDETGAIKVVKNIDDGSDEDSYVATGVLRAYNVNKETLTIGDTQFTMNYDELAGTGFYLVNKNSATKAAYTATLRDLFNQFVKYVVVDGEVVHVEPVGRTSRELIVVESYAGLSNDGYIVVNGYSTSDLEYDRFRIGSYDGWMKGDYYYYLDETKAAASFTKGTVYGITSYDADEDVYFVELVGEYENGKYEVTDAREATAYVATFENAEESYMTQKIGTNDPAAKKMKAEDKWILVGAPVEADYCPIYVIEGKIVDATWKIEGEQIGDTGDRTYLIVNAKITGKDEDGNTYNVFNRLDHYESGLVVLLSDKYFAADYNGADAEDWYLLGASEFEVEVFDLYTGKEENVSVKGTNVDLEVGRVYYTIDGVIVSDAEEDAWIFDLLMADAYPEGVFKNGGLYEFGEYRIAPFSFKRDYIDDDTKKKSFVKEVLTPALFGKSISDTSLLDGGYDVFAVEYDEDDGEVVIDELNKMSEASFDKWLKDVDAATIPAFFVYDNDAAKAVVYLWNAYGKGLVVETTGDLEFTDTVVVADGATEDVQIEASVGFYGKYVNEKLVGATVDGIKLEFVGRDAETATHANVDAQKWFFGLKDACELEDYVSIIVAAFADGAEIEDIAYVYESIVVETYGECDKCEGECNLVKSVYIPVETVKAVDGKNVYGELYIENDDYPVTFEIEIDDTVEAEGDGDGTLDIEVEVTFDVWTDAANTEYDDVYVTCGNVVVLY